MSKLIVNDKRFFGRERGLNLEIDGKSSDYINDRKERYVHSRLYGYAGVKYEVDGKLRIEGTDEEMTEYNSLSEEGKINWLREHNYSMPITGDDLKAINENYAKELKPNDIFAEKTIMKKMLNDGHGSYTYYSAVIAGEIDGLLNNYQNQPILIY